MILFLIELYLMGCAIAALFRNKLPHTILSLIAVFFGFFAYFVNVFFLTLLGLQLSGLLIVIVIAIETVGIFTMVYFTAIHRPVFQFRRLYVYYLISGFTFIILAWYFMKHLIIFATNDSIFLVVMAKGILESGFSQWYFASPLSWGVFLPIIQTSGMVFGMDYSHFIQPVLSIFFSGIFILLLHRAASQYVRNKWLAILIPLGAVGLMLSTNIYWVSQFYLHNNLLTGFSLLLTIVPIYLAVAEDNNYWLGVAGVFFIMFGFMRVENVIISAIFVILLISSQKIPYKKMLWMFSPYLVAQIFWNLIIFRFKPESFSNQLSLNQLMMVTAGIFATLIFLNIANTKFIKQRALPHLYLIFFVCLGLTVIGLLVWDSGILYNNLWTVILHLFGQSGRWFISWYVILFILITGKTQNRIWLNDVWSSFIIAFIIMIFVLGSFRLPFHEYWYDSANRMMLHIFPTVTFYAGLKISVINHRTIFRV